ncbi:MAG: integrase, partial [Rhodobacterales bacterium CG_4_10_14_0_8_um_filter_70_9]
MRPALLTASLAEGFDRMRLSRYGDAQWDLTPAVFRGNAPRSHASCDFAAIEHDDVRETLRAFLHARLNVDIPGRRSRIPPTRLRTVFHHARRFLEFVRLRRGAVDLPRVEQALLDDYARTLRDDRRRQPAAVAHLLDVVVDFHLYRERLPRGGLGFEPWGGGAATAAGFTVARVGGAVENRTPRMPEAVITPLLAWSLRYVTQFSHDIFAARAELLALEARRDALRAGEAGLADVERRRRHRDRLAAYFDRLRREGRSVPLWTNAHNGVVRDGPGDGDTTPPVNAHLLHLHMGVDVQVEPRFHVMLTTGEPAIVEQAIGALGVETGGFDTVPSAGPD